MRMWRGFLKLLTTWARDETNDFMASGPCMAHLAVHQQGTAAVHLPSRTHSARTKSLLRRQ